RQALGEADVVVVHVHVHEAPNRAVVVQHTRPNSRVRRLERVEHVCQRASVSGYLGRPTGVRTQDGRNADGGAHASPFSSANARKSPYFGLMVTVGDATGATASNVLSPSPVLSTTVSASGSRRPSASSFFSVATVTPPAVSAKMPSVCASSWIPSTISSSDTSSIAPPVRRATSM